MRISPLDIRKQTFKKSMRGADPEEVRVFLELVALEYEKVLQENAMMGERMRHQDERLREYAELEKGLRNALVTADRIASESRSASERDAQRILQDASIRAERILEGARERLQGLIREIEALRGKREAFLRRFLTLIQSQIGVVAEHAQDLDEVNEMQRQVESLLNDSRVCAPDAGGAVSDGIGSEDRPAVLMEEETCDSAAPDDPEADVWTGNGARSGPAGVHEGRELPQPAGHGLPRGLGRLLRGRQARLPLDGGPIRGRDDGDGEREMSENEARAFFPVRQRKEGFFEISASEEKDGIRQRQD